MEITVWRPFTARDRCDGCSARAKYLIVLDSGNELTLCGHHTEELRAPLEAKGAMIIDPRDLDTDVEPD